MDGKAGRQEVPGSDLAQVFYLEQQISVLEQSIIDAKKELENLQDKLMHTKQEEAEAKSLAKSILEEAEKTETALHKKTKELTEQKSFLEEQCASISSDLDKISGELQNKNVELEEAKRQLELVNRWRKQKLVLTVVTGVLVIVMFFGWIGSRGKISRLNGEISNLEALCQSAEAEKEEALTKLSDMEEYAGVAMVKVNSVYNSDAENHKLSDDLKASSMRYLCFDFDICFFDGSTEEAVVYMDIYNPQGNLCTSIETDVTGHTKSFSIDESDRVNIGHVNGGWGNPTTSVFTSGTYRIDFVYKDVIIYSQEIVIQKDASIPLGQKYDYLESLINESMKQDIRNGSIRLE